MRKAGASVHARTLWLGEYDPSWSEKYCIESLFGCKPCGITGVKIIRDKGTKIPLGYCFIEFDSHKHAQACLEQFGGKPIPDHPDRLFRLNWAERKSTSPSTMTLQSSDSHSIFVGDLSPDVTEEQLLTLFMDRFPSAQQCKVVADPSPQPAPGYGFVKFSDPAEATKAITEMNGHVLHGVPIRTSHAQARYPVQPPPMALMGYGYPPVPVVFPSWPPVDQQAAEDGSTLANLTIFVGNLDASVTQDQLAGVFAQFGTVTAARIPPGKGIGFVTMAEHNTAATAISCLNGAVLGGRPMRCAWGKKSSLANGAHPLTYQQYMYPVAMPVMPPGVYPHPAYYHHHHEAPPMYPLPDHVPNSSPVPSSS